MEELNEKILTYYLVSAYREITGKDSVKVIRKKLSPSSSIVRIEIDNILYAEMIISLLLGSCYTYIYSAKDPDGLRCMITTDIYITISQSSFFKGMTEALFRELSNTGSLFGRNCGLEAMKFLVVNNNQT